MTADPNALINVGQNLQSGLAPYGDPNQGDTNWLPYFPVAETLKDLKRYKQLGIPKLRWAAPDYSNTSNFSLNRIAWHLYGIEMALQMGFEIEWGVIPKFGLKPSEMKFFLDGVGQFAQQFQTLLNTYSADGTFVLFNENEASYNLGRDPIVSMSRTANVVTVDFGFPHSLTTGDAVIFYNAATGNGSGSTMGINSNTGFGSVTVTGLNTFTIPSVGVDGSSTVGWFSYGSRTIRSIAKRKATAIKALTGPAVTVPLIFAVVGNTSAATLPPTYYIDNFVSEGRGDLDISLNIYGEPTPYRLRLHNYIAQIRSGYNGFGADHFSVTEYNLWADDSGVPNTDPMLREALLLERTSVLRTFPDLKYTLFASRMPDKLAEWFPAYGMNVKERPTFPITFGQRPRTVEIRP